MLQDGRALAGGSAVNADICVIGAGPAGIALCLELQNRCSATIVLVDSGGADFEADVDALNAGDVVGLPIRSTGDPLTLRDVRRRQIGGGSNLWGGFCRPLNEIELGPQPLQPVAGWPLGADDLEPWYRAAHEVIRLGPYDYDAASWSTRLGIPSPLAVGPQLESRIFQQQPTRFGPTYLGALTDSTQITLLHHVTAVNVNLAAAGGLVRSISLASISGVTLTVNAATFVLATGGIETPRLLLASNDVVSNGAANDHDLVGRYYADHLGIAFGFALLDASPSDMVLYSGTDVATTTPNGAATTVRLRSGIDVAASACQAAGITGTHIEIALGDPSAHPTQSSGVTMPDVKGLLDAAPTGPVASAGGFRVFIEPVANRDSRVTLSNALDVLGRPRAALDWQVLPADEAHALTGMEVIGDALGALGIGRLQNAAGWVTFDPSNPTSPFTVTPTGDVPSDPAFGSTMHHMCTTRMDVDPTKGVVNPDCRAHTVDNLYIAGSSVFPVPVGHYPTITIVALAIRLANHLANGAAA